MTGHAFSEGSSGQNPPDSPAGQRWQQCLPNQYSSDPHLLPGLGLATLGSDDRLLRVSCKDRNLVSPCSHPPSLPLSPLQGPQQAPPPQSTPWASALDGRVPEHGLCMQQPQDQGCRGSCAGGPGTGGHVRTGPQAGPAASHPISSGELSPRTEMGEDEQAHRSRIETRRPFPPAPSETSRDRSGRSRFSFESEGSPLTASRVRPDVDVQMEY